MDTPKTLDETVTVLKTMLSEPDRKAVIDGTLSLPSLHFNFGMSLRNNWGLWAGSELRDFFLDLGIFHADDMSGIILENFNNYVRNEPFDLDAKVKYYREYWVKKDIYCDEEIKKIRDEQN